MSPSMSRVRTTSAPVFKELSGLTQDQFAQLVIEVGQAWEADRAERLDRPDRRRAQGAGRKHAIPFAARLLMVLIYLRWNISYRALGSLFGVSKDAVLRTMDDVLPLLAERGIAAPDRTQVRSSTDLEGQLANLSDEHRTALVERTHPECAPIFGNGRGHAPKEPPHGRHQH